MQHHCPRPMLARTIADDLQGKNPLSDAADGLFLAGPRRTGKSDFLKQDLLPELERRGFLVMYVDLWEDKSRSPMAVIADQLGLAIQKTLGLVAKVASQTKLESLAVPGLFKIDTSKIGKTDGFTLYRTLEMLREQSKKQIVLIIDEAQHALTSEDGDVTMSALKSARDQMKTAYGAGLLLVMSGSHHDKLMRLLDTVSTPFWGSQVSALPLLDAQFVRWVHQNTVVAAHPEWLQADLSAMTEAFEHFGHRPPFYLKAVKQAALQAQTKEGFDAALLRIAQSDRQRERDAFSAQFAQLEALQRAVLQHLLEQGKNFRAFDATAMALYESHLGKRPSTTQIQRALDALRQSNPPLVWKSLRGDYSLYDQDLHAWFAFLQNQLRWPPAR